MSEAMIELLGDRLVGKSGEVGTGSALKGKTVALYFSAHWCGPCRGFTPVLKETYEKVKAKGFEIVFVSSDRDQESFNGYFGDMPWLALPFEQRAAKEKLSRKFKVAGIPTLVLLDEDANVINKDGRQAVLSDREGADFPWRVPQTPGEVLSSVGTFTDAKGNSVSYDSLKGKRLALYFSAHWCGPCRMFTPELIKRYHTIKAGEHKDDFEVIFVSADRDPGQFEEYAGSMPWLRFSPFEHAKAVAHLNSICEVRGIPSLQLLSPTHAIANPDGRSALAADPECKQYPWKRSFLVDMADGAPGINDHVAIVALVPGASDDVVSTARDSLRALADKASEEWETTGREPTHMFYLASAASPVVDRIRALTKSSPDMPALLALDIADNGAYYTGPLDFSADAVAKFVKDVDSGAVERQQMQG